MVYPGCCGLPLLEAGDEEGARLQVAAMAADLAARVEGDTALVGCSAGCVHMLRKRGPELAPENEAVRRVAERMVDASSFVRGVDLETETMEPLGFGVILHEARHAEPGAALALLKCIPGAVVDRVGVAPGAGAGGLGGLLRSRYQELLREGKPAARAAVDIRRKEWSANDAGKVPPGGIIATECRRAGDHLRRGMADLDRNAARFVLDPKHPVELVAAAYQIVQGSLPPEEPEPVPEGWGQLPHIDVPSSITSDGDRG